MRRAWPAFVFAAVLALFERLVAGRWSLLPVWMLAAFAASAIVLRAIPWRRIADRLGPRPAVLYLILVRHFAAVLGRETGRTFRARSLCTPRRYGPGWFRSLAWASVAVLRRGVIRAERLYAALAVRGFE